ISNIDINDPDFPTGATQTEGTNPTTITILSGQTLNEIDGFYETGTLTGHLYFDENGNGTQDGNEPNMPNVDVEITDALGETTILETDANGDWSLELPIGDAISNIDVNDPDFPTGATQTEGTNPTTITILSGQTLNEIDGFYETGTLTGHLYFDENGNGTQDGNEPNMPGVNVEITDALGETTILETDANGDWSLELPIGDAISNIDINDPDFPTGATQTEGTNPTTTTVLSGQTSTEIDGFFQSGTLTGHLYFDENGNGTQDGNEPNMPNVDVEITDALGETTILETDANGDWSINLPPGNATSNIDQNDPDFPTGSIQTEGNDPTTTTIISGQTSSEIDGFYETGTLTGHLYFDENGNGTQDENEPNMPNVDVEITDVYGAFQTVTTDANGDWSIDLPVGISVSNINQNDPDFPTGVTQTQGSNPTVSLVTSGFTAQEIDGFYESGTVMGHIYFDINGNGEQDFDEPNMPNVDVDITTALGDVITVETNINGDWNLIVPIGTTIVDINQNDPDFPLGATQTEGTDPSSTDVAINQTYSELDGFFESAKIIGHLYFDLNGNGTQDNNEPDMPNVDVEILDGLGNTLTVTTDANGDWNVLLPSGLTQTNIDQDDPDFPTGATQTEGTDPTTFNLVNGFDVQDINGFFESGELSGHLYFDLNGNGTQDISEPDMPSVDVEISTSQNETFIVSTDVDGNWNITVPIGTTVADINQNDPDFPTGATQIEGTDPTNTDVSLNQSYSEIDGFYETGELSGHIYYDDNGNGTQDANEPDMPNIDVEVTDALGETQIVTTDENGNWSLSLPAGNTLTFIDENDPDFPIGATQTEGANPTDINVINGDSVSEIDGYFESGELSGLLYFDINNNGMQDIGEGGIPNIDVEITTALGEIIIVETDANGFWSLVAPIGTTESYIDENDPDFPIGMIQTEGTNPTTSNISIADIVYEVDGFHQLIELTGHLYFDGNGNGTQDMNESNMPNVDVEITNSLGEVEVITTDNNGDWNVFVPVGNTVSDIDETDSDFPEGAVQTEGTNPTSTLVTISDSPIFSENDGFFTGIEIFNAVSTNEDVYENNFFRIDGIQAFPDNNLKIYNRQGVKVFDVRGYGQSNSNLFTGESDGNVTIQKDKKLPTGTYFYILTFTNQNGDREEYKGYLHLN
ncbi:MAG: gliding motility-associated C-terminal domain-containing protein, partial [Psychroflexus sp.]